MHATEFAKRLLVSALIAVPLPVLACQEIVVSMGKGLATQAYIAPNPANVLILWSDASHNREYRGLELAGHHLTLVADVEELSTELDQGDYDIVIAPIDSVDAVAPLAAEYSARLVPIVSRDMRHSPEIRDRFDQYLVEDAGVAKLLTVINRSMSS